jgi:hypothetical protein
MSIVDDVLAYLASAEIVDGSSEWPSVRRNVHDGSDRLVIVTEDGGVPPETPSPTGIGDSAFMEPAVQVRVRGEPWDSDSASAKAQDVFDALHGFMRGDLGSTYYIRVAAQTSSPVFIGFDTNGRPEFTISFRALRTVA